MQVMLYLSVAVIVLLIYIIGLIYADKKDLMKQLKLQDSELGKKIADKTTEALNKSRSVLRGNVTEEIAPLLPGFKYDINDLKLLGSKPVDYIIFDGMSELRDNPHSNKKIDIIIADVKFNKSALTPIQRAIKQSVKEGRVRFEEIVIDRDNNIKIK